MAKKPVLVIMAAGMGSRYGGLKQMDPVGPSGELILDYSLFDAKRAGFERAVIIIKEENEKDFREVLGDRVSRHMQVDYAYQSTDRIPEGFTIPEGRVKPWGTGHAVLCAADKVDGAPFCAINADDYYGREAFQLAYDHLSAIKNDGDMCMVGYLLKNTLSETGSVARGVCELDGSALRDLTERTHIISTVDGPLMTEDGKTYTWLSPETVVSMNMWGFPGAMMDALKAGFPAFLTEKVPQNPLKAEYFLPSVVDDQLNAGKATVQVYTSGDKWYGVTYREDRAEVVAALAKMGEEGKYPTPLWP